jgi:hypothetical protein
MISGSRRLGGYQAERLFLANWEEQYKSISHQ